jgi:hypothetical protein
MSVFWVAQWTVQQDKTKEHEELMMALLQHVRKDHPSVLTSRTWRVRLGAAPATPGRIWMEEYESLTAVDTADRTEGSPACDELWKRVHEMAVPGTFVTSVWVDNHRTNWK